MRSPTHSQTTNYATTHTHTHLRRSRVSRQQCSTPHHILSLFALCSKNVSVRSLWACCPCSVSRCSGSKAPTRHVPMNLCQPDDRWPNAPFMERLVDHDALHPPLACQACQVVANSRGYRYLNVRFPVTSRFADPSRWHAEQLCLVNCHCTKWGHDVCEPTAKYFPHVALRACEPIRERYLHRLPHRAVVSRTATASRACDRGQHAG